MEEYPSERISGAKAWERIVVSGAAACGIVFGAMYFIGHAIPRHPQLEGIVRSSVVGHDVSRASDEKRSVPARVKSKHPVILGLTSSVDPRESKRQRSSASSQFQIEPFCLPFASGNSFLVTQSGQGPTHSGAHLHAIDFAMPVGTPIRAARGGLITKVIQQFDQRGQTEELLTMANLITIQHRDGTFASYGHLEHEGSAVRVGDRVRTGQLIGYSGNTGFSTGPHLHFEVYTSNAGPHESLPVSFRTEDEPITALLTGKRYRAKSFCE